jgi:hypothetical protein
MLRKITLGLIASLFVTNGAVSATAAPTHAPAPKNNWIERLPYPQRETWACVLWHESRSTQAALNLTDNNPYGSSGIFQIEQGTWAAHQLAAHVPLRTHVWQASIAQQFAVARAIFLADGFSPWWSDGCF